LYEYVKTGKLVESGSWAVEGIGEDFVPEIADMSLVTDAFEIDDEESFETVRELLRKEGIFGAHPRARSSRAHCVLPAANQTKTCGRSRS